MTLTELANETLTQKHRRLMQEKCGHEEVYSSTVVSVDGAFTNSFCLDCGKSWHSGMSPADRGTP
jgi:hypothetical protein